MRKLATCVVFLVLLGVCAPSFAQSSQQTWHDMAQKNAAKQRKEQTKEYRKALKRQNTALKKQRKQAAKDQKMWKKRSHAGF